MYQFGVDGVTYTDGELSYDESKLVDPTLEEEDEPEDEGWDDEDSDDDVEWDDEDDDTVWEDDDDEDEEYEEEEDDDEYYDEDDDDFEYDELSDDQKLIQLLGKENAELYEHYFFYQSKMMFDRLAKGNNRLASNGRTEEYLKKKQAWLNNLQATGEWEYCGFYHIEEPDHDYCTLGHALNNVYFAWNLAGVDENGNPYPSFKNLAFGRYNNNDADYISMEELLVHPNVIKFGSTCVGDFFNLTKEQTSILSTSENSYRNDKKKLIEIYTSSSQEEINEIYASFTPMYEAVNSIGVRDVAREIAGEPTIASPELTNFFLTIVGAGLIPPQTLVRNLRASIYKDDYFAKYNKPMYCPSTLEYLCMALNVKPVGILKKDFGKNHKTANLNYLNNMESLDTWKIIKFIYRYFVNYSVLKMTGHYQYTGANAPANIKITTDGGISRESMSDLAIVTSIDKKGGFFTDIAYNGEYFRGVVAFYESVLKIQNLPYKIVLPCIEENYYVGDGSIEVKQKNVTLRRVSDYYAVDFEDYEPMVQLSTKLRNFLDFIDYFAGNRYAEEGAFVISEHTLAEAQAKIDGILADLESIKPFFNSESDEVTAFKSYLDAKCKEHNDEIAREKERREREDAEIAAELALKEAQEEAKLKLQEKSKLGIITENFETHHVFKDRDDLLCYMSNLDYSSVNNMDLAKNILDTCKGKGKVSDKQLYHLEKLFFALKNEKVQYGVVDEEGNVTVTKTVKTVTELTDEQLDILKVIVTDPFSYDLKTDKVDRTVSILRSVLAGGKATEKQMKYVDIAIKAYQE